jgi:hypothetical protein
VTGVRPGRGELCGAWHTMANKIIAGTGRKGVAFTGGPAVESSLGSPQSICVDSLARVYVADSYTTSSCVSSGMAGSRALLAPDILARVAMAAAAEAELNQPYDVSLAPTGDLYIADFGNHWIRQVTSDGLIRTVAGTGEPGYDGDGSPATKARLNGPRCLRRPPRRRSDRRQLQPWLNPLH